MGRYWKCTMINDENDFTVGKIYETNDEGTGFKDDDGWYYAVANIEYISSAEFEEIDMNSSNKYRYWKCVMVKENVSWFSEGKIYKTDEKGYNVMDNNGDVFRTSKVPVDFIPWYGFEETSQEEWLEQEYKAYYKGGEEMKNKRYWKCITSDCEDDFTVGKIYISDGNGLNYKDNTNYVWRSNWIDNLDDYVFEEVFEDGEVLTEYNKDMVNHPSHYNSNSKGIEVIDVMDAFTEDLIGIDAIDIGTAIKYIGRLGKKDNPVQEVKKAIWYLQHYVDRKEEENDND